MEVKAGQIWRNKKSGNLVQVVPDPYVLVFTSPKGELVAEHSLVVFEQLYEPAVTEEAQMIKPEHPSSIRTKGLAVKTDDKGVITGIVHHKENASKPDMVNKPPHYKDASGIECKEITCHREMPFSLGNAIKYLYRAGNKGNLLEDLKKAEWYLKVAYLNGEKVPDDVVLRLHEVAAVRKTETGRALNMVALELIADAYRTIKSVIEDLESSE